MALGEAVRVTHSLSSYGLGLCFPNRRRWRCYNPEATRPHRDLPPLAPPLRWRR